MQVRTAKVRGGGSQEFRIIPWLQYISNILIIQIRLFDPNWPPCTITWKIFFLFPSSKTSKWTSVAPFNYPIFGMICWTLLISSFVWIKISIENEKKTISSVLLGHQVHMLAECKWWFNKSLGSVGCVQTSHFDKIGLKKTEKMKVRFPALWWDIQDLIIFHNWWTKGGKRWPIVNFQLNDICLKEF